MSLRLDLPPEAEARLQAEAQRRGITVDELIAELSTQFAGAKARVKGAALTAFIGSGNSGDVNWATRDIHEIRREMAERSSEIG